nr:TetR/AcrR family transcriptional regulator [Mycobacterium lepromatosis]
MTTANWHSRAAAEQLLEDRPLTEISVYYFAKGAGISRPTFYFASKEAMLLTLLDRVFNKADGAIETRIKNRNMKRGNRWRTGIKQFF